MIKPNVDIARLTEILYDQFGQPPANLAPIESGLTASVFSFDCGGEGYVIRIATKEHAESLRKDGFIGFGCIVDMNADGVVDIRDISAVAANFGSTSPLAWP